MNKLVKIHLLTLSALILILVFQNCSQSGKSNFPVSYENGLAANGYCQFFAPVLSSANYTANISYTSNLPQGVIYISVSDTNGNEVPVYPAQVVVSGPSSGSVQMTYNTSDSYTVLATWQADGYQPVGCRSVSFAGSSGGGTGGGSSCSWTQAPTCTSSTCGQTLSGSCVVTGTSTACNTCTGNTPQTACPACSSGGGGTNSCPATTVNNCELSQSSVNSTPVAGLCIGQGSCYYTCTSSGWVHSSGRCIMTNN